VLHGRPVPAAPGEDGTVALVAEGRLVAVGQAGDGAVRPAVVIGAAA
jgi:hypothetical protein